MEGESITSRTGRGRKGAKGLGIGYKKGEVET